AALQTRALREACAAQPARAGLRGPAYAAWLVLETNIAERRARRPGVGHARQGRGAASIAAAARDPAARAACTVPQCPVTSVCSPAKYRVSSMGCVIRSGASRAPAGT